MTPARRWLPLAVATALTAGILSVGEPASALPLQVFFESDADTTGGVELAVNSYATFDDFFDGITASSQFSDLNVTSPYSVGGVTYDGTAYRVLFESDADTTGGVELAINTYLTLDDFIDGNTASSQFSDLNVTSPYSVVGITYDGVYRVLFESDADTTGGVELAINTYLTLDDFFDGITASSRFSDLNVTSPYSVAGFLIEAEENGDSISVAEPGTLIVFAFGLAAFGIAARYRLVPRVTAASR